MEYIQDMRREDKCAQFFQSAKDICEKHDIPIKTASSKKRKRKVPQRIADSVVTEDVGLQQDSSGNGSEIDELRKSIFYPIIDAALNELRQRFSSKTMEVLCAIDAFTPRSNNFLNFETLSPLSKHFEANIDDLEVELKQLSRLIERKRKNDEFSVKSLLDMLQFVEKYEDAFYETKRLLQIASTIPVTSAEAERTFSTLKLIKTHLRTTMADMRLSSIAVISVHKKRAWNLDMERIVDTFVQMYPNCRISLK